MTYKECLEWMVNNKESISGSTIYINADNILTVHFGGILTISDSIFPVQYYRSYSKIVLATTTIRSKRNDKLVTSVNLGEISPPNVNASSDEWFNFELLHNIGRDELVLYKQIYKKLSP